MQRQRQQQRLQRAPRVASPSIQRIERLNYGLAAVLILGSLFTQSRPVAQFVPP